MGAAIYFDFLAYCIDLLKWVGYAIFALIALAGLLEFFGVFDR